MALAGEDTEDVPELSVDGPGLKVMDHECVNGPIPPETVTVVEPVRTLARIPDELCTDPVADAGLAEAETAGVVRDFQVPPTPIQAPVTYFQAPPTPI